MKGRTRRFLVAVTAVVLAGALLMAGLLAAVPGLWERLYYGAQGYRVGAPSETWPVEQTLIGDGQGVRVAVVGDPGTGGSGQYDVVGALEGQHEVRAYDAVALPGDLIYPSGELARIDEAVLDPFAPLLRDGVELLPALGNHDYESGQADQIMAALGRPSPWYAQRVGPALFVVLDTNRVGDESQTHWLEQTLRSSNAPWTITVLHHPPYSAGPHGSDVAVRDAWSGLFSSYGVDLVVAGHDHDYQRSDLIDGVLYVVSGAGAKVRPTGEQEFTAYAAATLHYLDLQVTPKQIHGQAIAVQGEAFDEFTIR